MRERLGIPGRLDGMVWRYTDPGRSNRRHRHAELELNLITRGSGTYLLGTARYVIRRGDLLWLFPAQEHVLFEQSRDFEMWVAVFRRRGIRRIGDDPAAPQLLAPENPLPPCRRLPQENLARLGDALRELGATTGEPALFNAGLAYLLLKAWKQFGAAAEIPVGDVHPAVERAARLIRESPSNLSLPEVAERSGLSAARLSRLFHQQTGMAMVDFRNRQRVTRFLEIYGTGQRQTMLGAALDAGFGSYPQFHRVFRSVLGCSPAEYRKQASTRS